MWDFFQTVRHRHSVRRYQAQAPVEPEKLHAVLETACTAPSAGDLQAYHVTVVSDRGRREALGKAAGGQPFIAEAPVCLVFCADPARSAGEYGQRGATLFATQDATIAAAYAQLAIVAAGMGSAWVGSFDADEVRRLIGAREGLEPVAMLSMGYPDELPEPTPRRPLDEMVDYR